jgi:hypothetical protein
MDVLTFGRAGWKPAVQHGPQLERGERVRCVVGREGGMVRGRLRRRK